MSSAPSGSHSALLFAVLLSVNALKIASVSMEGRKLRHSKRSGSAMLVAANVASGGDERRATEVRWSDIRFVCFKLFNPDV